MIISEVWRLQVSALPPALYNARVQDVLMAACPALVLGDADDDDEVLKKKRVREPIVHRLEEPDAAGCNYSITCDCGYNSRTVTSRLATCLKAFHSCQNHRPENPLQVEIEEEKNPEPKKSEPGTRANQIDCEPDDVVQRLVRELYAESRLIVTIPSPQKDKQPETAMWSQSTGPRNPPIGGLRRFHDLRYEVDGQLGLCPKSNCDVEHQIEQVKEQDSDHENVLIQLSAKAALENDAIPGDFLLAPGHMSTSTKQYEVEFNPARQYWEI
jgi:hypothetical protein